jgi:hypothetical protein
MAGVLSQADVFGAGLAVMFSRFAIDQRACLLLEFERRSAKKPSLQTLPLLIGILPAVVAAITLPGIMGLYFDVLQNCAARPATAAPDPD